jgi:hypothetical protein
MAALERNEWWRLITPAKISFDTPRSNQPQLRPKPNSNTHFVDVCFSTKPGRVLGLTSFLWPSKVTPVPLRFAAFP